MIYKGNIFKNLKFSESKALQYGFIKNTHGKYTFKTNFFQDEFNLNVTISNSQISIIVIENATKEEFTPIYLKDSEGKYLGKVKNEYKNILNDIAQKCFSYNIFKSEQAIKIIGYVGEKYKSNPEYLWVKFPNNAIFRDSKSKKWYGAILTVDISKFYPDKSGDVEVINLKASPEIIENIVDNNKYFPAYHMNKKHWFTIILNNSVKLSDIYKLIDTSYETVVKKKKK